MKFCIKNFINKCDQIRKKLRIWSHLLKKSLMKNFIFCAGIENHLIKDRSLGLRNSLKREPFQIFLYLTLLWRKSRTYYQFVQSWSLSFNVRFENKIQRQKRISENFVVFSRFNISLSFSKERKQWKFYSTLFNEIENLKYWKPFYMIFEYFILLSNNLD